MYTKWKLKVHHQLRYFAETLRFIIAEKSSTKICSKLRLEKGMDSFSDSREKLHSNVLLLKKDPIKCHIPKQRVCKLRELQSISNWQKCDRNLLRTDTQGLKQRIPVFFAIGADVLKLIHVIPANGGI